MTRDSGAPAAGGGGGGGGGGEGARRCSHCGHHGHNARTCTGRPVRLFGVRISDKPIRKSASMGNIAHLAASAGSPEAEGAGAAGAREDGYGSEDLEGNNPSSRRERKRGEAWTEEEHKKFLVGLNALGKGDWRGISRNYVVTRTPTQVASHAQKYFLRQTNLHRRKRRSSLFDMVIDEPADQQLSRTSSQELEERVKNPQSIAAPVTTPPGTTPMLAPVPMNVPMPVLAPQPEEQKSTSLSSNNGEAGIPRPEAVPSYGYPMMFPPPYYPPAFIPVPCYYMPVLYGPQDIAHPSPQVVKPLAVHSKPPVNVEDLYSMYTLSLRGESNGKNGVPALPLPPKAVGTSERRSAFHGKGPADGASSGVCFA